MATLLTSTKFREFDLNGDPLAGGKIYTYAAGTTTPLATYTDRFAGTPNANPIILDSNGEASVWVGGSAYKFVVKTSADVTLKTVDNFLSDSASSYNDVLAALALQTGASLIGHIQSGSGAIVRTVSNELSDYIHIRQFGGSPSSSAATNSTALTNAIAFASSTGKAGVIIGPGGTWNMTAGVNFASANISIIGDGKPTLSFSSGSGVGFKLDAGTPGNILQNIRVENFILSGGPSITDCFYSRGIVRSMFKNIECRECTNSGFTILFGVLNTYDHCVVSNDLGSMTSSPSYYWYLDDNGNLSNHTQANLFLNCEASGAGASSTKTGFYLKNAILNTFLGGTAESLSIGVDISDDICRENAWYGFDMEDNQTYDLKVKGYNNSFYNSFAQSSGGSVVDNVSLSSGVNTLFCGGYYRKINRGASSSDTTLFNLTLDDTLGSVGTGSYKRYNCIQNTGGIAGNKTGTLKDVLGPSASVTYASSQGVALTFNASKNESTVSGRIVQLRGTLTYTSAGSAGSSLVVGIESTYAAKSTVVGQTVGTFQFIDDSASTFYSGVVIMNDTTELIFRTNAATGNFGNNPGVTVANGDSITFTIQYPTE